jgi:hypothetical protein
MTRNRGDLGARLETANPAATTSSRLIAPPDHLAEETN